MNPAEAYDWRVGKWSRKVGEQFLDWLAPAPDLRWLDLGCGGGALSQVILDRAAPAAVAGIDPKASSIATARARVDDPRASFHEGTAEHLPFADRSFDIAVSGLAFNFMADASAALGAAARVLGPGRTIAGYVWDFAGDMQVMRVFWEAAAAFDDNARDYDQGPRFPLCKPGPFQDLFAAAGLTDIQLQTIDVTAAFPDLATYWDGMMIGEGSTPSYARAAGAATLDAIRARLEASLPVAADGSFELTARAFAVRGQTANH